MTITQKLRNAFPGISTLIDGFVRGLRAGRVFNKQMNGIKTLQSELNIDNRMVRIAEHSPLSYYDAFRIITFLQDESEAFNVEPNKVIQFVIERACKGYTVDMILVVLSRINDHAMMEKGGIDNGKE